MRTFRIREAHDRVVELIKDPDASTREAAVRALRSLWEPDDFAGVFEVFLKDRSQKVKRKAAWTLRGQVVRGTWRPLFDAWCSDALHRHRQWACEIAAEFGGRDVQEQLLLLRNDGDGLVRRAATNALSAIAAA